MLCYREENSGHKGYGREVADSIPIRDSNNMELHKGQPYYGLREGNTGYLY